MIPLSDVAWGPINATERDTKFHDKWIEPAEIRNCLEHDCWIVTGEKGSGKSAIQRAIREIHRDTYYVTPLVDFDKVTFGLLYENLQNLSRTTQLESSVTLSNYWQYAIIIELIKACANKDPELYGDLLRDDRASRHVQMPLNKRLMKLFEESWNLVDEFTAARRAESDLAKANMLSSGGLSSDLLHNLSTFPLGPEYDNVKQEFFRRIEDNGHRVILILDGFDTLITNDSKASAIQAIFSSLVDAILSLRKSSSLSQFIGIKALIPHDRFINLSLRDSDKVGSMHRAIRWNHDTLKEFVEKRIAITPKIRGGNFPSLWRQVFPESITNSFYKLDEDSFQYLVRHTLFRPRQLQIYLSNLANAHTGINIDPSMVPKSVLESSLDLAKFFIDEYRLDHPNLEKFILTFERRSNVMEFKPFREMVAAGIRRFHPDGGIDVDEKIDVLYTIGLFGVIRFVEQGDFQEQSYYPPTRESTRHYIDFFYRKPYSKVSSRLTDTSLIAFHPIFVNFANLKLHPSLIIG